MSDKETLAIPQKIRDEVDARDGGFCRMCGKFLGQRRAIHHILFGGDRQGMGGRRRHVTEELISLCYLPGDLNCHQRVHANKDFWCSLLLQTVTHPSRVTALQLLRWTDRKSRTTR